MKYIKTKDGKIFDLSEICIPYQIVNGWIDFNSQGRFEIAKEADTIEGLFDKIVRFYQFGEEQIEWEFVSEYDLGLSDWKRQYAFHIKEHHLEVRGAIFTKWGLKYVAKLNDKGEWKLI